MRAQARSPRTLETDSLCMTERPRTGGRPDAADILRRALVLLADHELNASTFATRVAVSTGAPLAAGVLSGLATALDRCTGGRPSACWS